MVLRRARGRATDISWRRAIEDRKGRAPATREMASAHQRSGHRSAGWPGTRTSEGPPTSKCLFRSAAVPPSRAPERRVRAETRTQGTVMSIRPVKRIVQAEPTVEGAGVKLRRAFGFGDTSETDPFLLLDDFRNDHPGDYLA